MKGFVKLKVGNDWGTKFLSLDPTGGNGAGTHSVKNAINFYRGEMIRVRFPDKTERLVSIELKRFETQVSDHGHSYKVSYDFPGFTEELNGLPTWVSLADVEVEVDVGGYA